MVELESEAFLLGIWKNYEEMEENLTIEELEAILEAARAAEYRHMKFAAALKGVDLDDNMQDDNKVQEMQWKADAIAQGRSVDEVKFEDFGINIISELD